MNKSGPSWNIDMRGWEKLRFLNLSHASDSKVSKIWPWWYYGLPYTVVNKRGIVFKKWLLTLQHIIVMAYLSRFSNAISTHIYLVALPIIMAALMVIIVSLFIQCVSSTFLLLSKLLLIVQRNCQRNLKNIV